FLMAEHTPQQADETRLREIRAELRHWAAHLDRVAEAERLPEKSAEAKLLREADAAFEQLQDRLREIANAPAVTSVNWMRDRAGAALAAAGETAPGRNADCEFIRRGDYNDCAHAGGGRGAKDPWCESCRAVYGAAAAGEAPAARPKYPRRGTCANCGRKAD